MKKCPKCGYQNNDDAKFCAHCGFHFDEQESKSRSANSEILSGKQNQQPSLKTKKHHKKRIIILLILFVLIAVLAFLGYEHYQSSQLANSIANNAESTSQSSDSNTNSSQTNNGNDNNSSGQLSENMGPKETAASIIYYASKNGAPDWNGQLKNNHGVTIKLSTAHDLLSQLSEKGTGMVYEFYNDNSIGDGGESNFVYTLGQDGTIYIYRLPQDNDPDNTVSPDLTVSKSDMIKYLNSHGYASQVKSLMNNVQIDTNGQ